MNSKTFSKLQKLTHLNENYLKEIIDAIEVQNKKQLIFSGPPGTGKTYVAKELVSALSGDEYSEIVQFHPSRPIPSPHLQMLFPPHLLSRFR